VSVDDDRDGGAVPLRAGMSRRELLAAAAATVAVAALGSGCAPAIPDRNDPGAALDQPPTDPGSTEMSIIDAVIVGGGPAGLAAALTLGRARRTALLFDAGTPRNAAATHIHNFVTRDGTPPAEFRRIGREQLAPYTTIAVRDVRVTAISGERDAFAVETETRAGHARLGGDGPQLAEVELADGERVACEVLYAHPPQRQVDLVARLGLTLDAAGFVQADPMTRRTSTPGIYAAGDLTSRAQGAVFAAATGAQAAGMLNHDLCTSA
jgi:thioredoxin reductase